MSLVLSDSKFDVAKNIPTVNNTLVVKQSLTVCEARHKLLTKSMSNRKTIQIKLGTDTMGRGVFFL